MKLNILSYTFLGIWMFHWPADKTEARYAKVPQTIELIYMPKTVLFIKSSLKATSTYLNIEIAFLLNRMENFN